MEGDRHSSRPGSGDRVDPGEAHTIDPAVVALAAGRLILLPTETVYGLAGDAANPRAVAAIFQAKGRPSFNPLISHVADLDRALALADLDLRAVALGEAFWPGPLTLVAPFRPGAPVCDLARAGLETVAVRVPAHPMAQAILRNFANPVVAPSANRSGRPSPTTLADAVSETGAAAEVAVDGGACAIGLESTVIGLIAGAPRLLRPGAVTREQIEAIIGPLAEAGSEAHRSPGRLFRHYAPRAPVRLGARDLREGEAFLAFGEPPAAPAARVFNLSPAGDLAEAAAHLFAMLRAADALCPTAIAIAPIPEGGLGEAINDRLRRAAGQVG